MNTDTIRVIQFCEKWNFGGIESILINIYKNIDRSKVRFDFLVSQNLGSGYDKDIETLGGTKRGLVSSDIKSPMIRVIKNYKAFYKDLKKNKYEIIHFNACNGSVFICVFLAKLAGVPIRIIHSHNTDVGSDSKALKVLFHNICKYIFGNSATHYLACSHNAAKWLFNKKVINNNNYMLSNNGIQIDKFIFNEPSRLELREELGIEDKFVIGHIGRFEEQKNHDFLIDIFNEVYKKNTNSVLILIGTGELENDIRAKVTHLGLTKAVRFIGVTDNIPKYMSAMDVFLFPSLFEGLGIVAIEAQAASLKVVASTELPKETMVTEYIDYVSLNESPKYWADAVLKYKDGYIRRNTSQDIKDKGYDIKTVAQKLEVLYRNESNKLQHINR